MNTVKKLLSAISVLVVLFFVTVSLSSCSKEDIMATEGIGESKTAAETVMSDHGPIKLLHAETAETAVLEKSLLDSIFFLTRLIPAKLGGSLIVGNFLSGFSSIVFDPFDLYEDTQISFKYVAGNTLEANFQPHGIQFRQPVRITLSYKSADLQGVDENSLRIYYYNEETHIWELIGGRVNKLTKTVTAEITHFSRYALAHS